MPNQFFPNAASEVVDVSRRATIPWRNWFASVNAALASGQITDDQLTATVAKILISLGTQDGTADTIVDVADASIIGVSPVIITGDMRNGWHVRLPPGFGEKQAMPLLAMEDVSEPVIPYKGEKGDAGRDGLSALFLPSDWDMGEPWPMAAPAAAGITEAMVMAHVAGSV